MWALKKGRVLFCSAIFERTPTAPGPSGHRFFLVFSLVRMLVVVLFVRAHTL